MSDRALRQRKAPVNYVGSPFQTPEKEREQKWPTGRHKRKLVSSDQAAGDKENNLFNDPPSVAVEEPRPEVQQDKKRGKAAKKQLADSAGAPNTADQQPQAGSQEEKGKDQKAKRGKKVANVAPLVDATPSDGAASEGHGPGENELQEQNGVTEKAVGKRGAAKGAAKNVKGTALDKKKVSQQVAAATAAVFKAQGKKASSGSTRAAKKGSSKGGRGEPAAGPDVSQGGETLAGANVSQEGVISAGAASGEVRKGATTRGALQAQKPVANSKAVAKEKKPVSGGKGEGSGGSQPGKATRESRKRKAQERAVVEIDGGDEADALPPVKKAAGPSTALVPFINASKVAAERQRQSQGKGLAVSKDAGAFLKLQEAYSKLQTKYQALKQLRLDETESLFDAQKKVVKDHSEAAKKLVSHWKEQVARIQEEEATIVETAKRARDLRQENDLLKIKFIEQEEKHLLIEARLQELQSELQDATQHALEYARPGPENRAAEIQTPAEDVGAKGAAATDVQVQAPTEPAKPDHLPVASSAATRELPRGFVEVRKEDLFPGQSAAAQSSELPALDREQLKREGFEEGLKQGLKKGLEEGQKQGFAEGLKEGLKKGLEEGQKQGFEDGVKEGVRTGLEEGLKQGDGKGFEQGLEEGQKQAMQKSFEEGWAKGMKEGLEKGLEEGLEKGLTEGLAKGPKQGLDKESENGLEDDLEVANKDLKEGEGEGFEDGFEKGLEEGLEKGLEEGLEEGLEDADPTAGLGGDPDADSAWRELLQILTGCCADECGENRIRFTHERSGLVFYLTGTPQDDDVTGDVGREVDTLSRASSFFDADAAGNVSFLYEPEEFGLLDDDVREDSELRRSKTLTMRQVPRLVHDILGQTVPLS
ncbi:hypothetical protein KFL_000510030 [Klebsormidium nitens]|uniref:Uncharacterized protein n=1 Tax=Klebsormidium nitens TaxID=105231 RepID=A0A1Y1HQE6_KLENI|nr:hypothetical protein KFL_000510030 [Klebsormidium nitens]|eukprot:GAQ80303.1 hypothetical protein KFL_000510030 [Klebsormidium nitens]